MGNIISKLEKHNLLGRSGSMFPVAKKWEIAKNTFAEKKYVVCNASEGEIKTFKDYFLLKNYPEIIIEGIEVAIREISAQKAYIYLNSSYYDEIGDSLKKILTENIEIVRKKRGYIGGEETSIMEAIEGKSPEPRIKPPFPCESGLWGYPTLVNNVETFYCVAKINSEQYNGERFYSVSKDAPNSGVFQFSEKTTVREILEKTNNTPSFDYFLQVGGGACGAITLPEEIDSPVEGLGSIVVYKREETDPYSLMKKWVDFLLEGNCDKCTPCREGLYRIMEMIEKKDFDAVEDMFLVMEETSLCPLGKVAVTPFKSLLQKIIYKNDGDSN